MRNAPKLDAEVVTTLNNGDVVQLLDPTADNSHNGESISGLYGFWTKVKYRQFIGYVFSPYLGSKYMLFYENGEIEYYPKVKHWYGVFYDSIARRERIKPIDTHTEKIFDTEFNQEETHLLTNNPEKTLFIIATNEVLEEKEIGDFTRRKPTPQNPGSIRLKPGDDVYLSTAKNRLKMQKLFIW